MKASLKPIFGEPSSHQCSEVELYHFAHDSHHHQVQIHQQQHPSEHHHQIDNGGPYYNDNGNNNTDASIRGATDGNNDVPNSSYFLDGPPALQEPHMHLVPNYIGRKDQSIQSHCSIDQVSKVAPNHSQEVTYVDNLSSTYPTLMYYDQQQVNIGDHCGSISIDNHPVVNVQQQHSHLLTNDASQFDQCHDLNSVQTTFEMTNYFQQYPSTNEHNHLNHDQSQFQHLCKSNNTVCQTNLAEATPSTGHPLMIQQQQRCRNQDESRLTSVSDQVYHTLEIPVNYPVSSRVVGDDDSPQMHTILPHYSHPQTEITTNVVNDIDQHIEHDHKTQNHIAPTYQVCYLSSGSANVSMSNSHESYSSAESTSSGSSSDQLSEGTSSTSTSPTRDEKRAREANIPMSYDDIVNLTIDQFNESLAKHNLTESQLNLIKDIRRRGKNKVAAQSCRKRKMEQINELQHEVNELSIRKRSLTCECSQLIEEHSNLIQEYDKIQEIINHIPSGDVNDKNGVGERGIGTKYVYRYSPTTRYDALCRIGTGSGSALVFGVDHDLNEKTCVNCQAIVGFSQDDLVPGAKITLTHKIRYNLMNKL